MAKSDNIKKLPVKIIKSIISILVGMMVTMKYFLKKSVTMRYPEEKCVMTQRYRGVVSLVIDKNTGKHRCIACLTCARVCPNYSLQVECEVDELKKRYPKKFILRLGQCMFCGLCVEACPTGALEMDKEYEIATYTREGLERSLLP
ncbi:MAG: 4Fe-4S binding protein [Candidatus Omnitrophota bacterium]|nr:4Fe-4S binding protein [Candidatus Omnitrophota bacterium]